MTAIDVPSSKGSPVNSPSTFPEAIAPISESDGQIGKSPGLIRRISRGAANRLRKRSFSAKSPDHGAGPVLLRHASDLRTIDVASNVLDAGADSHSDDDDDVSLYTDAPENLELSVVESAAPTVSAVLEQGTWVQKVTKKKRKLVRLRLDPGAAKVRWNPSDADAKVKSRKQFYIDNVREVRVGDESRNARQDVQISTDQEDRWMTILYDAPDRSKDKTMKTMHFIAPNQYILRLWQDALKAVERERIEIMNALSPDCEKSNRGMRLAWSQLATATELTFDAARTICRKMEINCPQQIIRAHFDRVDTLHTNTLDYDQYQRFIDLFKVRHDIRHIFDEIRTGDNISLDDFLAFLKDVQGVRVEDAKDYWIAKYHSAIRKSRAQDAMNLEAFQRFLSSSTNACMPMTVPDVCLDRPLNEYYISSSHNTYLLGRQVASASTVEGYISALVKGCRCVEVDCWDGKDKRPVVNHGHTLTSEVLFEDCIHVINKYAFASTPYPLIISLEVHCGPEQQAVMVDIMTRIFKGALVSAAISEAATLPSPEDLRNRILIKVKSSQPFDRRVRAKSIDSTPNQTPSTSASSSPLMSVANMSDEFLPDPRTSNIIPVLSALGVYVRGMKWSDFASPGAGLYNHIFSLAENTYTALFKDIKALEKHNAGYLMRVYPARMRLDSSNFDPLQSWRHGVQMAALNWQTNDVNMQVNSAMFAAGLDRTGYVLKPQSLRTAKGMSWVTFTVKIISAQRLPKPKNHPDTEMNTCVTFELITAEDRPRGVVKDKDSTPQTPTPMQTRTKLVQGGFSPRFDQTISASVETAYPELLFVRWIVWSTPDATSSSMLATFTAKLDGLYCGYRHLPLYNAYGERFREAKLFVRLQKQDPISLMVEDSRSPDLGRTSTERSWPRKIFGRASSIPDHVS